MLLIGEKKFVCLQTVTLVKSKCPVFPEGPLSVLFVVLRSLKPVAIFCEFESLCETPPTVESMNICFLK